MQDHLSTCQSILSTKILFFENFIVPKFCLILFDFIFQKIIFFFTNLLFTIDRSSITVHKLLFTDYYCSRPKLQYNNCIAIQFSAPSPFLTTLHHIAIQFLQYTLNLLLQYNPLGQISATIHFLYCDTTSPSGRATFQLAIQ